MSLKGRVALVTGGSRGIGREIALALADAGADVIVNYAGNEAKANEVVSNIEAKGQKSLSIRANVASFEEMQSLVKQAVTQMGRLDILVNNAGITRDNLLLRMKEDEWDDVIETNLKGVFNGVKAASRPMMKQRFGRIINVSSVVGVLGNPGQANYVAAKAGVIGLTKTAAKELASRNITVNAVAPGFIDTDMTAKLDETYQKEIINQIPLGRLGDPRDVAHIVCFLASERAAYMTGQTLHVDGGMAM